MYTLPRGGMYWEEKFPEDQEICYGRHFAPISNVDVSLEVDNFNIVAVDVDVDVDASNCGWCTLGAQGTRSTIGTGPNF